MPIICAAIGALLAVLAVFIFKPSRPAAFVLEGQQHLAILAACIMGRSSNGEWAGEFDNSMAAGRAVQLASEIKGIIDHTWGPTPAIATEDRAKQLIRQDLRWMLPEAVKNYQEEQERKRETELTPTEEKVN